MEFKSFVAYTKSILLKERISEYVPYFNKFRALKGKLTGYNPFFSMIRLGISARRLRRRGGKTQRVTRFVVVA